MSGIGLAIASVFGFFKQERSADNKEKLRRLRKLKNLDKCMDAGENMFFSLDMFFTGKLNKKQLKHIYQKYRRIFFENN